MRLKEKIFFCDMLSIISAVGVLVCGVLLLLNYEMFHGVVPVLFGCGGAMFLALLGRNYLGNNKARMITNGIMAVVMALFALLCEWHG